MTSSIGSEDVKTDKKEIKREQKIMYEQTDNFFILVSTDVL